MADSSPRTSFGLRVQRGLLSFCTAQSTVVLGSYLYTGSTFGSSHRLSQSSFHCKFCISSFNEF